MIGPPGTLNGQSGAWQAVTGSEISLDPKLNPTDNYGVQDVLADPSRAGTFYAFVCYQGVWKSEDFGSTWAKVSVDNNLDQGRPWGEAIAPDGSYMLACTGYGTDRWGAWKSKDGGRTWQKFAIVDNSDPYMFDIDPSDAKHVLSTSHSVGNIYESKDGGETWADKGDAGVDHSGYVYFLTSTTWLLVAQSGSGGTRRSTDSGAHWTDVASAHHVHGGEQIYVDPMTKHVYLPSHGSVNGVFESADLGASFTMIHPQMSAAVFATGDWLYTMDSGASLAGNAPLVARTKRSDTSGWTALSTPAGLTNGAKRAAVARDPASGRWVIVAGCWNAGIWRYIE